MTRVRLTTEGDVQGAIAEVGEDGVWTVIESETADDLEVLLNLLFGRDFDLPELEYSPYPSYWRAREAIKEFDGEILEEIVPDPPSVIQALIDGAEF